MDIAFTNEPLKVRIYFNCHEHVKECLAVSLILKNMSIVTPGPEPEVIYSVLSACACVSVFTRYSRPFDIHIKCTLTYTLVYYKMYKKSCHR